MWDHDSVQLVHLWYTSIKLLCSWPCFALTLGHRCSMTHGFSSPTRSCMPASPCTGESTSRTTWLRATWLCLVGGLYSHAMCPTENRVAWLWIPVFEKRSAVQVVHSWIAYWGPLVHWYEQIWLEIMPCYARMLFNCRHCRHGGKRGDCAFLRVLCSAAALLHLRGWCHMSGVQPSYLYTTYVGGYLMILALRLICCLLYTSHATKLAMVPCPDMRRWASGILWLTWYLCCSKPTWTWQVFFPAQTHFVCSCWCTSGGQESTAELYLHMCSGLCCGLLISACRITSFYHPNLYQSTARCNKRHKWKLIRTPPPWFKLWAQERCPVKTSAFIAPSGTEFAQTQPRFWPPDICPD